MVDLSDEMTELWGRFGAPPPGRGRLIQFVSAAGGEGASTVAREFARVAAQRSTRPVWLVDMDLWGAGQADALTAEPERYGPLGPETAGAPNGAAFFSVEPPSRGPDGRPWPAGRYLSAHGVGGRRFWVTRFRADSVRRDQSVEIVRDPTYWTALRRHAEWVIVDAPAADRSQAALVVAPFMDATVLVVAADGGDARSPGVLRDAIAAAGGRCAGLVFNRASIEPPRFLQALLA
jgi:Mrp family chromosome partitioning ATPase